jgi:tRNA threonylcarbamoyl adenosine modification protein YeaZ
MGRSSVALRLGEPGTTIMRSLEAGPGQAERLIPLIEALMDELHLSFSALDLIAVGIGPGTFSGIRSGVAAARGIALAASVPVLGVTSFAIMKARLESLARAECESTPYGLVAPAGLDAFYCQIVTPEGAASEIVALEANEAANFMASRAAFVAGPGAASLEEAGGGAVAIMDYDISPAADVLADLSVNLSPAHNPATPYYVKPADARPQSKPGLLHG